VFLAPVNNKKKNWDRGFVEPDIRDKSIVKIFSITPSNDETRKARIGMSRDHDVIIVCMQLCPALAEVNMVRLSTPILHHAFNSKLSVYSCQEA